MLLWDVKKVDVLVLAHVQDDRFTVHVLAAVAEKSKHA